MTNLCHRVTIEGNLSPEFLAYLIQSHCGKACFLSVAHRTTNLASINSTKLKAFPVVVPDHLEQLTIVNCIKACDDKFVAVERELSSLSEMFQVMLEELMTGRSPVPAVPEPALESTRSSP